MQDQARAFLLPLLDKIPYLGVVLMGLGGLVVIGQAVVIITPSKADDEAWAKIERMPVLGMVLKVLASFAPIQKRPPA